MSNGHKFGADMAMRDLIPHINRCDGVSFATDIAIIYGNLEAAFYEKEIDNETKEKMKMEVRKRINDFENVCSCTHRKPGQEPLLDLYHNIER